MHGTLKKKEKNVTRDRKYKGRLYKIEYYLNIKIN